MSEKREPTERELEERLLRELGALHKTLERLLRRKWDSQSKIGTTGEHGTASAHPRS